MLTKELKREYRSDLFRHLDGIVTCPTAFVLYKSGIITHINESPALTLSELAQKSKANKGYLNVAIRVLASQGWLTYKVANEEVTISITSTGKIASNYFSIYNDVYDLMQLSGKYHYRNFEEAPFRLLESIFKQFENRYGMESPTDEMVKEVQDQMLMHIEGVIVGPTVVALGMTGMFHKYFMEASFRPDEFHADADSFERLLDIFAALGWFTKKDDTFRFTDKGMFYARRASAYGVTVSYIPAFRKVEELLFGDPTIFWNQPKGSPEVHVDREMNVWGSGGAHSSYFKVIDEVIIEIFNQPIDLQPKGIVDMGCGNGAFLIHLFDVIETRTLRGKMLEEYPLFLVGADYNTAALKVTRANIIQADIWAKVIFGDIGDPDLLASDLSDNYGIDLKDLLNVRTFLDHNRIWSDPKPIDADRVSESTGAYAFRGEYLSGPVVEQNLLQHMQKWSPYVQKFGLLVIELHTISPDKTAANLGRTAATAYDATHGFSDQYIVEIEVFHKIAEEAGLYPVTKHFVKFPDSELATVSINLLKAR